MFFSYQYSFNLFTKVEKIQFLRGLRLADFDELPLLRDELKGWKNNSDGLFAELKLYLYFCSMMKNIRFIITLVTLCQCLLMQGQIKSELAYRRYTTQDGLPQLQTERLWQDSRGYIYIGTLSGFVRYDGKLFTPFLKGRRENIVGFAEVDGQVRALGFRRQWLIDRDEVEMLPIDGNGKFLLNNFNTGDLPNGWVILEDEQEQNRRLCKMTSTGIDTVMMHPAFNLMTPDRKLYLDGKRLYVPTGKTLAYHRLGDQLYAFGVDGIFTVVDGKNAKRICPAPADWQNGYFGLIVRGTEQAVIADEHSLYTFDGKHVTKIATGFNLIKDVLIDRWERLWVATYQGVYCFFNQSFTNHRLNDQNDIVRAISDQLVMGTLNGKVMVDGKVISDDPEQFYAPSAVVIGNTTYMAGNGDVTSVTDGQQSWLHLPSDRYQFIAKKNNQLIIGSRKCIAAYDLVTRHIDTLSTDIPHPWCAALDKEGRLWVGSSFGLYRDGVKVDFPQKLVVTTMEADQEGNVFFASADSLFIIRHHEVKNIELPLLSGHEIRSVHVSPKGFLVIAVLDGVFVGRISKTQEVSDLRFFNHLNGFTALEPLKATMAETPDGTVWLAGVEEMVSFNPAMLLSYHEEDTYIAPPMEWWQHWWVWLIGLYLLALLIWGVSRWYEKRRNLKKLIHLEQEKQNKQRQIEAIRKKAIEAEKEEKNTQTLAHEIMEMTQKPENERLSYRIVNGTFVCESSDIAYFKADGNYTNLVTFHRSVLILVSIGSLEKSLNPHIFVRADRSTIVNIQNISQLNKKQHTCSFRSSEGVEVEASLLSPAFKRLEGLL